MKIYLVMGLDGEEAWVQEAWTTWELAEEGAETLAAHPDKHWDAMYYVEEVEVKGE